MPIPIDDLNVLLIQVREAPEVAHHELTCVCEQTKLPPSRITTHNVADNPDLSWREIERADAVLIGGAGAHSAVDDDDFTDVLASHVRRMTDESKPLFGSCWGHQFIARALGGAVIKDPDRKEVGIVPVDLTDAAAADPLLEGCPASFDTLMGHEDRVTRLPAGAVELARSAVCDNQAFRVTGKPIWGTQFHSELSPARLLDRITRYRHYMPDDDEFEALKSALRPTPIASRIMHRFLQIAADLTPAR